MSCWLIRWEWYFYRLIFNNTPFVPWIISKSRNTSFSQPPESVHEHHIVMHQWQWYFQLTHPQISKDHDGLCAHFSYKDFLSAITNVLQHWANHGALVFVFHLPLLLVKYCLNIQYVKIQSLAQTTEPENITCKQQLRELAIISRKDIKRTLFKIQKLHNPVNSNADWPHFLIWILLHIQWTG